jgi:aminoglycoside phosphotransferase (APT) family kinase protein
VHNAALSDLQDEFAQVIDTAAVLAALAAVEAACGGERPGRNRGHDSR